MRKSVTEVTVETERVVKIRSRQAPFQSWCPQCDRQVMWVGPDEAGAAAGVDLGALYRGIQEGVVHCRETTGSAFRVCLNSLLARRPTSPPRDEGWGDGDPSPIPDVRRTREEREGDPEGPFTMPAVTALAPRSQALPDAARSHSPAWREKAWKLGEESFNRLLLSLDPSREAAGRQYTRLHHKLSKFFECRGCVSPEDLADETINRVARWGERGERIRASDPAVFFFGVAKNVLREYQCTSGRESARLDCIPPSRHPSEEPQVTGREDALALEQLLSCLDACLNGLPAESRERILGYYQGEGRVRAENRKRLADQLGITVNALAIKAHRTRERLERAVTDRLGDPPSLK